MALPKILSRIFNGAEGGASVGNAGPTGLKTDIDALMTMINPAANHADGTPGGIAIGNLATGEATATPTAGKLVLYDGSGNLPGSIASAVNANNVTTNINGKSITDIFESNGVTVKNATTAGTCSGNASTATKMDGVRARVYLGSQQNITSGSVKLNLDSKTFDPKNIFTGGRFTPGVGTYLVSAKASASTSIQLSLKKNTTILSSSPTANDVGMIDLVSLTDSADYIEIFVWAGNSGYVNAGATLTHASIIQIA